MPNSKIASKKVQCPYCDRKFKTEEDLKQHSSAKHNISKGEITQETDDKEHLFCNVCNRKFSSINEMKKHQKEKNHLYIKDLIILMEKYFGNLDLHKEAVNYTESLSSKTRKRDKSILFRIIEEKIKESGHKKAIIDLYKLAIKYNPGKLKFIENLGDLYAEFKEYKEAILTYKKALKYTDKKHLIQSKLSSIYFKIGDQESAIELTKYLVPMNHNVDQYKIESKIRKDWKRLKSELRSSTSKKVDIPQGIVDEKFKKFEKCDKQYLFWYLDCPSTDHDLKILNKFMYTNGAKLIQEFNSVVHYRIFDDENETTIHIKIMKKDWGLAINIHRDLFKHQYTIFDKECLELISKLYLFLKKNKGHRFILPRQENKFQSFLGERFIKRHKIKK